MALITVLAVVLKGALLVLLIVQALEPGTALNVTEHLLNVIEHLLNV